MGDGCGKPSVAEEIRAIGVRKIIRLTKLSQRTIDKFLRGKVVRRKTYEYVLNAIRAYKSRRHSVH